MRHYQNRHPGEEQRAVCETKTAADWPKGLHPESESHTTSSFHPAHLRPAWEQPFSQIPFSVHCYLLIECLTVISGNYFHYEADK